MSTRGNALAGSLAATLLATEIHKLLAGEREYSIAGHEVFFDPRYQTHMVSRLDRNPACRFSHIRWDLQAIQNVTLREALERTPGPTRVKSLFVPGSTFVSRLLCESCKGEEQVWRLRQSLDTFSLPCPHCSTPRPVRGFDLVERLSGSHLEPEDLDHSLTHWGLRSGEVFAVEGADGVEQHFLLSHSEARESRVPAATGASIVVAGLGNIGSFLVAHLARLDGISRVVLCDPDLYELGQERAQDLPAQDIGRGKAEMQAERLRSIRPDLAVEVFAAPVEDLPTGELWGALAVSCLDSRAARLRLAARAWHLDSPFLDAAVEGGTSLLVRSNVYLPSSGAACVECALEPGDYDNLEQILPCDPSSRQGPGDDGSGVADEHGIPSFPPNAPPSSA